MNMLVVTSYKTSKHGYACVFTKEVTMPTLEDLATEATPLPVLEMEPSESDDEYIGDGVPIQHECKWPIIFSHKNRI